jgi:polysaccharide export outer membrane protein
MRFGFLARSGLLAIAAAAATQSQAAPPELPPPRTNANPTTAVPSPFSQNPGQQPGVAPGNVPSPGPDGALPALMAGEGDYILAPGDTLDLMVYKEPDLSMRSKIARDGRVQLPLLGEVAVAGLSVREAQNRIRDLYNADYLVDPQIYLNIAAYVQRKITVIGQVSSPGSYELMGTDSLGILEAVGMAGGFTRIADTNNIQIKRKIGGKTEVIKVNSKRLDDEKGGGFKILPGDIITVGESWY